MSAYKVLRGISYGSKRAEAGDVVTDLPSSSVKWLVEQGIVEAADAKPSKPAKREPVSSDEGDK